MGHVTENPYTTLSRIPRMAHCIHVAPSHSRILGICQAKSRYKPPTCYSRILGGYGAGRKTISIDVVDRKKGSISLRIQCLIMFEVVLATPCTNHTTPINSHSNKHHSKLQNNEQWWVAWVDPTWSDSHGCTPQRQKHLVC